MLELITWNDPTTPPPADHPLRQVSQPVENFDQELTLLARQMLDCMYEWRGAGLSAVQIGRPLRLFVMNPTPELPNKEMVFVNPILDPVRVHHPFVDSEEGCLSLPGRKRVVKRLRAVRIQYSDLSGRTKSVTYHGLWAIVAQHEMDHLRGFLLGENQSA